MVLLALFAVSSCPCLSGSRVSSGCESACGAIDNARWLEQQVKAEPLWRVLAPVALQTLCLRHEPAGRGRSARPPHAGVGRAHQPLGRGLPDARCVDGRWMVRVSIGSLATERAHVAELWRVMRAAAESA